MNLLHPKGPLQWSQVTNKMNLIWRIQPIAWNWFASISMYHLRILRKLRSSTSTAWGRSVRKHSLWVSFSKQKCWNRTFWKRKSRGKRGTTLGSPTAQAGLCSCQTTYDWEKVVGKAAAHTRCRIISHEKIQDLSLFPIVNALLLWPCCDGVVATISHCKSMESRKLLWL